LTAPHNRRAPCRPPRLPPQDIRRRFFLGVGVSVFVMRPKEGEKGPVLSLLEVWIMLILKAANGRWVEADKIMAIALLLEKIYGLTKACFVPSRIPWSRDVDAALKRLAELKLAEASPQGGAYRLTEEGRVAVERYPPNDPRIRYPFSCIKFFADWSTDTLAEYIQVNYPDWKA